MLEGRKEDRANAAAARLAGSNLSNGGADSGSDDAMEEEGAAAGDGKGRDSSERSPFLAKLMVKLAGLDDDGLPRVGLKLKYGDPVACRISTITHKHTLEKHKNTEPCVVDQIRLLGEGECYFCVFCFCFSLLILWFSLFFSSSQQAATSSRRLKAARAGAAWPRRVAPGAARAVRVPR